MGKCFVLQNIAVFVEKKKTVFISFVLYPFGVPGIMSTLHDQSKRQSDQGMTF